MESIGAVALIMLWELHDKGHVPGYIVIMGFGILVIATFGEALRLHTRILERRRKKAEITWEKQVHARITEHVEANTYRGPGPRSQA